MSDKAKLILEHVTKKMGDTVAVNDISFEVKEGEFYTIIGPSGCGKTTTLRCIAGLETPDSGLIYMNGRNLAGVRPHERNISLIFQDLALFPHMNVYDNIAYGLRMKGFSKEEVKTEVDKIMGLVHLEGLGHRDIRQLSGGQQQRVALARSLVIKPGVILFDEPIATMDLKLRDMMLVELKSLHRELGFTGIYVTHDQYQAMILADRLMVMNKGRIEQLGTPQEVYSYPTNVFVAAFVGATNFIKCTVKPGSRNTVIAETAAGDFIAPFHACDPGTSAVYAVRPENVVVGEAARNCPNRLKVKLSSRAYSGVDFEYVFQLPNGQEFEVKAKEELARIEVGGDTLIGWDVEGGRVITESSVVPGIDIDSVILGE